MNEPLVSIVMPTYNRADTLPRAIDSVVAQTYPYWELVLIDDGSTDETPRLVEAYAAQLGDRLTHQRQDNRGACAARNRGITLARGELVAFLDADDVFAPKKLERQVELMTRRPDLGLTFTDYACVDLNGRRIESAFDHFYPSVRTLAATEIAPRLYACAWSIFDALLRNYFIATIVGMVRRSVLGADVRFDERFPYAHEWLFFLSLARRCRAGYVDEPLSVHYYTRGSITRSDARQNLENLYALLHMMPHVLTPLKRRQRRVIARHLGDASRRLGTIAYRQGHYRRAAGWFLRALRHDRTPRDLWHALDALGRHLRHARRTGATTGGPQAPSPTAR